MIDFDGVRIGLTGLAYEQSPRMSSPGGSALCLDHRHHQGAGGGAARGRRGFRLRGAALQSRRRDQAAISSAPPNCCSPATPTTCSSISTADARWSSPATTRITSPAIDVAIAVREDERQAHHDLVAALPRDRHRDRHARSGGRGRGRALRGGADRQDDATRSAPPRSRSTSATATVRTREAAIGNLFADAMRDRHARGRRDAQRRRHPRRQDLRAGHAHHAGRRARRAAVQQPHRGAGDQRRAT